MVCLLISIENERVGCILLPVLADCCHEDAGGLVLNLKIPGMTVVSVLDVQDINLVSMVVGLASGI